MRKQKIKVENFGRIFIFIGLIFIVVGIIVIFGGKIGLFRLPGDIEFGGKNWRLYFPIATSIIISIILTIILWLISFFRR